MNKILATLGVAPFRRTAASVPLLLMLTGCEKDQRVGVVIIEVDVANCRVGIGHTGFGVQSESIDFSDDRRVRADVLRRDYDNIVLTVVSRLRFSEKIGRLCDRFVISLDSKEMFMIGAQLRGDGCDGCFLRVVGVQENRVYPAGSIDFEVIVDRSCSCPPEKPHPIENDEESTGSENENGGDKPEP